MGQFALLARSPIGIFVFSEEGELLNFRLFSVNPQRAFEEYNRFGDSAIKEMSKDLKKEIIESDTAYRMLRKNFRDYAKNLGFVENDAYLNRFLSEPCPHSVCKRPGRPPQSHKPFPGKTLRMVLFTLP
jgi:hypothetical protein